MQETNDDDKYRVSCWFESAVNFSKIETVQKRHRFSSDTQIARCGNSLRALFKDKRRLCNLCAAFLGIFTLVFLSSIFSETPKHESVGAELGKLKYQQQQQILHQQALGQGRHINSPSSDAPGTSPSQKATAVWWLRSEAVKAVLRYEAGNGSFDVMLDELESPSFAIIAGDRRDSCDAVCGSSWLPNSSGHSVALNCKAEWAAFPDASECNGRYYGYDLPAFSSDSAGHSAGKVMINARPYQYMTHCDAKGDHSWRLCPCTADIVTPESLADGLHARVAATLHRQVTELIDQLETGVRERGQMNEWFATHRPENIVNDIRTGQVTFLSTGLDQNCYEACDAVGQVCQMHWFDLLNNCDALYAAFPVGVNECSDTFFGRDLPAFRPSDSTVLVNQRPRVHAASCGGRHTLTKRICGCGRRKGGAKKGSTFHTVYNVQPSRYFEWQVRYMHFWFKQANMSGQITRLLTAHKPDDLASTIPTHVAPPPIVAGDPGYTPYNKPSAVDHWLRQGLPIEDIIIVVDPDCMFVRPVNIFVEEGAPVAQQALYYFDMNSENVAMQIARRYCKNCTFLDPIAVPIVIHRRDLLRIAPLWLEKTKEIRLDKKNWPNNIGLGWTAEMFGYVFAASELGIRHEIWDLQVVPPMHNEITASIIHYHIKVELSDGRSWYKHSDDACCRIPWPLPANANNLTITFLNKLREAHNSLGEYNHSWLGSKYGNRYIPEVR